MRPPPRANEGLSTAFHNRRLTRSAVVLISMGLVAVAAHFAFRTFTEIQNRKHLEQLNRRIVHRAERVVDDAFIALGELVEKSIVSCEAPAFAEPQWQVCQRGTLKDIHVINKDRSLACSPSRRRSASRRLQHRA